MIDEKEISRLIKAIYEGKGGVVSAARTALLEAYETGRQEGEKGLTLAIVQTINARGISVLTGGRIEGQEGTLHDQGQG